MSMIKSVAITPTYGGTSRTYVLAAGVSTPTIPFTEDGYCVVTVDSATYMRTGDPGTTPSATVDGTDQYLPAGQYRIGPMRSGQRLAFRSAAGGNAWVTPSV